MLSSRDSNIIELWLERQASPHTGGCYQRDVRRLLAYVPKPLNQITLGDLQGFAQSLIQDGLAPISRVRTLAAIKSLFGFCQRTRHVAVNPATELVLPCYENCLAERIVGDAGGPTAGRSGRRAARSRPAAAALCRRLAGVRSLRAAVAQLPSSRRRR